MQSKKESSFSFARVFVLTLLVCAMAACASKKGANVDSASGESSQPSAKHSEHHKDPSSTSAQTAQPSQMNLQVSEGVLATGVENLVPQGVATSFNVSSGRIYCFTKILNADQPTQIQHVWLFNGKEMANVTLNVKSASWRTYSSKIIETENIGSWSVQVKDANGGLIKEIPFQVTGTEVSGN